MQYKPEIKHASGRCLRKPPLIAMPFFYSSGEQIRKGDRVLVHGEAGEVEFIADPSESPDDWFVKDQGGGICGARRGRQLRTWQRCRWAEEVVGVFLHVAFDSVDVFSDFGQIPIAGAQLFH